MQTIYLILMIILLAYVFLKKRYFDFYTIAALSTLVYCYPALIGKLRVSEDHFQDISVKAYICLCLHILLLLVCMICNDKFRLKNLNGQFRTAGGEYKRISNKYEDRAVLLVSFAGLALLAYSFVHQGGFQDTFNKMILLQNTNRFTEYMKYIALFTFVYAFTQDQRKISLLKITSSILIGYTFLLGHRSFFVIGIIAIFVKRVEGNGKKPMYLYVKKYWKIFLLMSLATIFILFIKNVFAALMSGQYELVAQRLSDPNYYMNTFLSSESNTILSNLQKVCDSGMTYNIAHYFFISFALLPIVGGPVISALNIESFSDLLNNNFNTQLDQGVGLGSTFLGEAYATGWYIFEVVVLIGVFLFISFMQRKRKCAKSGASETWFSVMLVYFTFYIHRNSLFFLLMMARAYAYIWLAVWILAKIRLKRVGIEGVSGLKRRV